ncbi:Hypothetical predicted protein [Olea europaea subsp. europaea]|uniref:Protein TIFY n=1 Tax=Olea europaea subsp. europaea TaxID=158383 RepID=A0A8S0R1I5_OLEEU|nr:Hypothetical predicted protein [Olea europaea subsp. europaea]
MSNSQDFSNRKRARKAPEKSNFVHTCNLLSQFIKKKGSLRDLNFEIGDKVESLESIVKADTSKVAATPRTKFMNNVEKSVQASTEQYMSIEPVPARGMPSSSSNLHNASNKAVTSREAATVESKNAQLTIFYAGKVLVFDDYPAEKVTELAEFASKESCKESHGILSNHVKEKLNSSNAVASTTTARDRLPPRPDATSSRKAKWALPDPDKEAKERLPPRLDPSGSHKAKGILLNSSTEKMNTGGAVAYCSRPEERISPQLEASDSGISF